MGGDAELQEELLQASRRVFSMALEASAGLGDVTSDEEQPVRPSARRRLFSARQEEVTLGQTFPIQPDVPECYNFPSLLARARATVELPSTLVLQDGFVVCPCCAFFFHCFPLQ